MSQWAKYLGSFCCVFGDDLSVIVANDAYLLIDLSQRFELRAVTWLPVVVDDVSVGRLFGRPVVDGRVAHCNGPPSPVGFQHLCRRRLSSCPCVCVSVCLCRYASSSVSVRLNVLTPPERCRNAVDVRCEDAPVLDDKNLQRFSASLVH